MSPELILLTNTNSLYVLVTEKSDIFSIGLSIIRLWLLISEDKIVELNILGKGELLITNIQN